MKIYHAIQANQLTGWQALWLTLAMAAVVFGGLYLINPSILNN